MSTYQSADVRAAVVDIREGPLHLVRGRHFTMTACQTAADLKADRRDRLKDTLELGGHVLDAVFEPQLSAGFVDSGQACLKDLLCVGVRVAARAVEILGRCGLKA